MKITLDTNCIVDLERNARDVVFLKELVEAKNRGRIRLGVAAISAAEKQPGGGYLDNFSNFESLLKTLQLDDSDILKPLARADIAFADYCVVPGDEMIELERKIHQILFSTVEFDYESYRVKRNLAPDSLDSHWRNSRCDVLTLWCHIWYERDVFVTSDGNFHKQSKKPRLIALGAKGILTPHEIASRIAMGRS